MKDIITELFGSYTPITYTDTVVSSSGAFETVERIPDGLAGVDFTFIAGVLLFGITLYCVLRVIGGLLRA